MGSNSRDLGYLQGSFRFLSVFFFLNLFKSIRSSPFPPATALLKALCRRCWSPSHLVLCRQGLSVPAFHTYRIDLDTFCFNKIVPFFLPFPSERDGTGVWLHRGDKGPPLPTGFKHNSRLSPSECVGASPPRDSIDGSALYDRGAVRRPALTRAGCSARSSFSRPGNEVAIAFFNTTPLPTCDSATSFCSQCWWNSPSVMHIEPVIRFDLCQSRMLVVLRALTQEPLRTLALCFTPFRSGGRRPTDFKCYLPPARFPPIARPMDSLGSVFDRQKSQPFVLCTCAEDALLVRDWLRAPCIGVVPIRLSSRLKNAARRRFAFKKPRYPDRTPPARLIDLDLSILIQMRKFCSQRPPALPTLKIFFGVTSRAPYHLFFFLSLEIWKEREGTSAHLS